MQKVVVRLPSEILSKGRKLPEGTERTWKGKKYIKKDGIWKPQSGKTFFQEQHEKTKAGARDFKYGGEKAQRYAEIYESPKVSKHGKPVDTITSDAMQHYAKVHKHYKPGNTLGQEGTVSGSFFRSKEGKAALKHLKAKGLIEPHTALNDSQRDQGPDAVQDYYRVTKKGKKLFDAARDSLKEEKIVSETSKIKADSPKPDTSGLYQGLRPEVRDFMKQYDDKLYSEVKSYFKEHFEKVPGGYAVPDINAVISFFVNDWQAPRSKQTALLEYKGKIGAKKKSDGGFRGGMLRDL